MEEKKTSLKTGFMEPTETLDKGIKKAINALGEIVVGQVNQAKNIRTRVNNLKAKQEAVEANNKELLAMLDACSPSEEVSPELIEKHNQVKAQNREIEAEMAAIEAEVGHAEEFIYGTKTGMDESLKAGRAELNGKGILLEKVFSKNEKTKAEWEAFKKSINFPVHEPIPWEELKPQHFISAISVMLKIMLLLEDVDKKLYLPMLHGPGLDELPKLGRRAAIQSDNLTGQKSVSAGIISILEELNINQNKRISKTEEERKKEMELALQRFTSNVASISSVAAIKLLDICAIELTRINGYKPKRLNTLVEIPLEKYMELCGIPLTKASMDKTRRIIKDIGEALYSVSLNWKERTEIYHMRILQERTEIKNGIIYLQFTERIAEYFCSGYIAHYALALLKADERNPNTYRAGRRLLLHHSNLNNQKQGTADIISVKALLEYLPGIPTYEEVAATDRAYSRRIIQPFKTALNSLDFIEWEYCNAKKAPLTKKQKTNFDYETFKNCYIKFKELDGPDMEALVEARKQKQAKAEARKEARRKKANT